MKARIKSTGEIADFLTGKNLHGEIILHKIGTASIFSLNEVEPIYDIDWQQVRIQLINAALTGLLANTDLTLNRESIVEATLKIADALVAEMKYAECRRLAAINTASVCENMTKIQKELQNKEV